MDLSIDPLAPLLMAFPAVLGLLLLAQPEPGQAQPEGSQAFCRILAAILCAGLGLRYLHWRLTDTLPSGSGWFGAVWAGGFVAVETLAVASSTLNYMFLARIRDRSADADARALSPLRHAPVDVFVATYNEDRTVLERTLVCAQAIKHPDLRIWVLDDGARDWVRSLAAELGLHYACRVRGRHAKAGNVNNGLALALATGRKPELILLLDADFMPMPNILARTLGLFEEQDVGIVQTPQHFFNPDPVQTNLGLGSTWPDEQRFFFNVMMPCKDAWGAGFCCGTSAVLRVDALLAVGGLATETVTEDMLTSFKLREAGFRTIYLDERLSLGLAPEGLREYVSQRSRWCLGAIQQAYTRFSFAGSARIGLVDRLSCLDGTLYWSVALPFKLLTLAAPLVFWTTGAATIDAPFEDLERFMLPNLACNLLFMGVITRNRILPVMSDVAQLLCAPAILRTVIVGLVRPFGHPFRVTAKGVSRECAVIHWRPLAYFAATALATAFGLLSHLSPYAHAPGAALNAMWSLFNIAALTLACAACVEPPRRRLHERFAADESATILTPDGQRLPARLVDISVGGARVTLAHGQPPAAAALLLGCGIALPFTIARTADRGFGLRFTLDNETQRRLTRHLYQGGYAREIGRIRVRRLAGVVMARVFG